MGLTLEQRAGRALASQGLATNWLRSCSQAELVELAALCSETGELAADVRPGVMAWREEFCARWKLTMED